MSVWTHVVGCMRIDGVPKIGLGPRRMEIETVFGPMCLFDNWNDDSTLPRGNEGGLQYQIIEYDKGLPWIAVPIWGDLRDFDDVEGIEHWWEETLAKFPTVRDAVLQVAVEGKTPVVFSKR